MTDCTPQTSASDRYAAAREALAEYEAWADHVYAFDIAGEVLDLAEALRALITPPGVHESEERIAERVLRAVEPPQIDSDGDVCFEPEALVTLVTAAVRAGIQAAHETWEPEVALRPTQEQMLRWLGIEYNVLDNGLINISDQAIDREED